MSWHLSWSTLILRKLFHFLHSFVVYFSVCVSFSLIYIYIIDNSVILGKDEEDLVFDWVQYAPIGQLSAQMFTAAAIQCVKIYNTSQVPPLEEVVQEPRLLKKKMNCVSLRLYPRSTVSQPLHTTCSSPIPPLPSGPHTIWELLKLEWFFLFLPEKVRNAKLWRTLFAEHCVWVDWLTHK